ncbi:haloacid dehalogenase type II [Pelagimonas sp. KU-00592-HH]|uniref:HAD family hydrolase n=1 Tax=Pelagimonas sp. KU-00592-HH TaxID=3127651 RepID=UPI0031062E5B
MSLSGIKALTFDTGGTVLDWHTGFREAFAAAGARHGITRDWGSLTNELRRRSMEAMLDLGRAGPPAYNFDEAHRFCLDTLLADEGLDIFDDTDRRAIAWGAPHSFTAWPDVQPGLAALRNRYIVASFTLLSYRLIIDSSRRSGLIWDAILSCEGLGVYKLLPESYARAATLLQLDPPECLMVACHPFDLDAARNVGFRTALIRRPEEWGETGSEVAGEGGYDLEVDSFTDLAIQLSAT